MGDRPEKKKKKKDQDLGGGGLCCGLARLVGSICVRGAAERGRTPQIQASEERQPPGAASSRCAFPFTGAVCGERKRWEAAGKRRTRRLPWLARRAGEEEEEDGHHRSACRERERERGVAGGGYLPTTTATTD